MKMRAQMLLIALATAALAALGAIQCGDDSSGGGPDSGTDTDSDTDTDTDSDSDTDTDSDTDADSGTDTDSDTDTDTDGFDMTIDLDCDDPVPGPTADDTCDLPDSDCTDAVCSEHLWAGTESADDIIGNYCYPDCSPEEPDGGTPGECEGTASYCLPFVTDETIAGCVPLGQLKAEWEVNLVPADGTPAAADQHTFPIAESFNCTAVGFTNALGMVSEDAELGDSAVIAFQVVVSTAPPKLIMLQVMIPMDSFVAGADLDLAVDNEAFSAQVLYVELQSIFNQTVTAAQIRALLSNGKIHVDEVADPCAGAGCPTSKGTMELDFLMLTADLDPALFAK